MGDDWIELEPAHLDSMVEMLQRSGRPIHLLGEGIPSHEKFIPDDPRIVVTSPEAWRARASAVARIGAKMADTHNFAQPDRLVPIYIRPPEAEEKFKLDHPQ